MVNSMDFSVKLAVPSIRYVILGMSFNFSVPVSSCDTRIVTTIVTIIILVATLQGYGRN